jgi:hypothetical protein
MFCMDIMLCVCVSSIDVFLWGSCWSCNDVVYVLLACRCVIMYSPLYSLYLGDVLCLVCGDCETVRNDECMLCQYYLLW